MTVRELKEHLQRRGMATSGRKQELIERALTGEKTTPPEEEEEDEEVSLLAQSSASKIEDERWIGNPPMVDGLLRDNNVVKGCYAAATKDAITPNPTLDRGICGVLVVPPAEALWTDTVAFVEELAYVCNANVIASNENYGKALEFLDERRCESIGLVTFGDALAPADLKRRPWDAVVAWHAPDFLVDDDDAPLLVLTTSGDPRDPADLRRRLAVSRKASDFLLRVFDDPEGLPNHSNANAKAGLLQAFQHREHDEDALLLCTAWFDLFLGRRHDARTSGPRASSLWIDDRL